MRKRPLILATASLALVVVLCGAALAFDAYMDANHSATAYLARLSDLPRTSLTTSRAQAALLERLPAGTPERDIYGFLEAHGIERDKFTGGQHMRYQPKDAHGTILGLLSDPPARLPGVCADVGYILRFQLDQRGHLSDILVERSAQCL